MTFAVPAIRAAVGEWRRAAYPGVSDTTRALLNHWFHSDHRLVNGEPFTYYDAQREAIESLIYAHEVAKARRQVQLFQRFVPIEDRAKLRFPAHDDFARYCTKMATGSGKTLVMALAVAWQYFNAIVEGDADCATTFLIIAPNIIVYERLNGDFSGGRIFTSYPIIPREFQIYWDMQFTMRGYAQGAAAQGELFLTNIQQLYESRGDRKSNREPEAMRAVLGSPPSASLDGQNDFRERILARGDTPVLVINDEAHHTHDPDSEWNKTIRGLHGEHGMGLAAQLDFTATPRHSDGSLFAWTISDYPLKRAIVDGIVKRPVKGITDIKEQPSDQPERKYAPFIVAGVERWREYRDALTRLNRKPVLFIMMTETKEADAIGDFLRGRYPDEFAGDKTLVIHVNQRGKNRGEVSRKDLDKARTAAKHVDGDKNPINAIVSVLMLREGWDVKNVTVIVGLRPYTSKANILPEQTIGRGLRLMFRPTETDYTERVDIIGNDAFIEFIEQLELEEDLQLDSWRVGKEELQIVIIEPLEDKAEFDAALPALSPILARGDSIEEAIAAIDLAALRSGVPLPLPMTEAAEREFTYEAFDLITFESMLKRKYKIEEAQTAQELIGYCAQEIASSANLPGHFAALASKVRDYWTCHAFGREVDLDSEPYRSSIRQPHVIALSVAAFLKDLRPRLVHERKPRLLDTGRKLSSLAPFPWSSNAPVCRKTVFNRVPCDNNYEASFARFLDNAHDVALFAKLPPQFGFSIPWQDGNGNLRRYYPDFLVLDATGVRWLVETKGVEDISVARKDDAARTWAQNATSLTGDEWRYLKVMQHDFESLRPATFADCAGLSSFL